MGMQRRALNRWGSTVLSALVLMLLAGCAMVPPKSFLDPTAVGMFPLEYREGGIRRVLTPRDGPVGLANATEPTPEDLVPVFEDYRFGPLDSMQVFINDFYQVGFPYSANLEVTQTGYISIPQLGLIKVEGMTVHELEQDLRTRLQEAGILSEPLVQVLPTNKRYQYFSVIGSVTRAGTYSLSQPDMRLLDVLGLVGDIGPEVKRLYVIRRVEGRPGAGLEELDEGQPQEELIIPPPDDSLDGGVTLAAGMGQPRPVAQSAPAMPESAVQQELESALTQSEAPATRPQPAGGQQRMAPLIYDPVTGEVRPAPTGPAAARSQQPEQQAEPGAGEVVDDALDEPFDWEDVPQYELSQRVIEIDVEALKAGDPRYNIVIRNRDLINVPVDIGVYYMMGEVARPGVYAFNGREITIKQAIASVGGFTQLAWPSRCEIIRREKGTDKQITIPVNLDRIFAGLDDDILLRDEDIVNVGTDIVAPFLFVIRNSFRIAYGFGFVYDRNFADKDAYTARPNPATIDLQRRQTLGLPF